VHPFTPLVTPMGKMSHFSPRVKISEGMGEMSGSVSWLSYELTSDILLVVGGALRLRD